MKKSSHIKHVTSDCVASHAPKLHLVKGKCKSWQDKEAIGPDAISDYVGLSCPKEIEPSPSETNSPGKSPEDLKASELAAQTVAQFRIGLINATELRKKYPREYKSWDDMKQRCKGNLEKGIPPIDLNPSFEKFADFLEIVGPRPHQTWSLDRIEPTGSYSPDNVRWASKTTQSRNRTNSISLTYDGVTLHLMEWSERIGVPANTLRIRKRQGWSDEEIIDGKRSAVLPPRHYQKYPRDYWAYTPWPTKHREHMERLFQRYGLPREHRLEFGKRYSQKILAPIMEEIDRCCWPDYHTPTDAEVVRLDAATRQHDVWIEIYRFIMDSWSEQFRNRLYRSRNLPDWVEKELSTYV